MTLQEFKAWFEGFTAALPEGAPNDAQWQIVKVKVAEIQSPGPVYDRLYFPDKIWLGAGDRPDLDTTVTCGVEDDGFETVEPKPRQYGFLSEV